MTAMLARRPRVSARSARFESSKLVGLLGAGRERGAVDFAVGTPGAPRPPRELIDAACRALRGGHNQYGHPDGDPELRAQLALSLGTPADPDTELTITVGSTEGLFVALLSIVDPGDEVVVLEPCYDNFVGAIAAVGGVPRFVRLNGPDWRLDPAALAAAFGPRTKALVINTPNNPTGHMLSAEELDVIADLCERWDVMVVSDEVYASCTFDGRRHISAADVPGLADRSVVIGSLSKSHSISGWRLGYLRADAELTSVLRKAHVAATTGATAPLQRAVADSGVLLPGVWDPVPELQRCRDRAVDIFSRFGLDCPVVEGGCYVFADISPLTADHSELFVRRLLDDPGVLVVPGSCFFGSPGGGANHVRIAFNKSDQAFEDAAHRLSTREAR